MKEAIADYRVAVKLQPGSAAALNDLGVALYEADLNVEALETFRECVLHCVAVCCSVLQCVAVRCSAVHGRVLHCILYEI